MPADTPKGRWAEAVDPILAQLNTARHFGGSVTYNKVGADALFRLIEDMARRCDELEAKEKPDGLERRSDT